MLFKSKKYSLLVLGITAIVCSRVLFSFFNDSEGPNLLVVMALAAGVYVLSLMLYLFDSSVIGPKKFWFAILVQIVVVTCLYFLLR